MLLLFLVGLFSCSSQNKKHTDTSDDLTCSYDDVILEENNLFFASNTLSRIVFDTADFW